MTTQRRAVRRPQRPRSAEQYAAPRETWYVGFDPSWTGYGLAAYCPATDQYLTRLVNTKVMPPGRRAHQLLGALEAFLRDVPGPVEGVCIEGFNRGARNGREEAGASHCVSNLALFNVLGDVAIAVPRPIAPSTLKKWVTGNGSTTGGTKGRKNLMLMATYKKWNVEFDNDNECDAYGLARLAAAVACPPKDLLAYERDVLNSLQKPEQTWSPPSRSPRPT